MEIDDILEQLERHKDKQPFPTEVIQAAIDKKEEITPYLIDNLKWITTNIKEIEEDYDYMLHFYSLYLLAHFKEKQAFQVIVDFLTIPNESEAILNITGDLCFDNTLARIFADVSNVNTDLIKSLIENREMPRFIREAAILSLTYLYGREEISREDILCYFTFLFDESYENENDTDDDARIDLVINASYIYPEELYDKIKSYFDRGKIEEAFIDLKEVQHYFNLGKEECLKKILKEGKPIDATKDMSSFLCFKTKEEENQLMKIMISSLAEQLSTKNSTSQLKSQTDKPKPFKKVEPVRFVDTTKPKIGRNEPCPCGSGKKYKKCCLN